MNNYNFDLDLNTVNTQSVIINWIKPNSKVLEFGPANGRMTRYLNQNMNCRVTIVEYDYESGKEASQYAEEAFIGSMKGDALKLFWDEETEKYDYIVFADVLEHLNDPGKVLKHAIYHLEDNGEILVSIPNVAHNSIIIDLINDKFVYQRTGLLDSTHVHFFTYKTFIELLDEVGLAIKEEVAIYSTVGANEINNTYEDVPYEIEKFLRKRNTGSVYQYVFKLAKEKQTLKKEFNMPFVQEQIRKYETQCFYIEENQKDFDNTHRVTKIINEGDNVLFDVVFDKRIRFVRFEPVMNACVIRLLETYYINETGEKKELLHTKDNSCLHISDLYYFDQKHPSIYYEFDNELIKRVVFKYMVLCVSPDRKLMHEICEAHGRNTEV